MPNFSKNLPFYWVVAADARAKRDGKFLEKLGIYNPNTNPATIEINVDNSVQWLQNGAQPTDTARAILSYKGVMLKNHLLGGLRKGALTEEQVEEKFNAWLEEKQVSVAAKVGGLDKAKADAKAAALKAEKEVNEKRAAALAPEVETAETPEPNVENADKTDVAPVVEKEVIEANEDMAEAPAVEEVIEKTEEEVKPADTGDTK